MKLQGLKKYFPHTIITLLLVIPVVTYSQFGGTRSSLIFDLKTSARVAALGGDFLPMKDADITLTVANPSLIDKSVDNHLALNFINLYTGINSGVVSYSKTFNSVGSFTGSLQYVNYGKFKEYDEYEDYHGDFSAADYIFILGWGRKLDSNFSIGANLKPMLSQYESYSSMALAVDLAANYHNPKYLIDVTLLAKNIGAQLTSFDGTRDALPFELELGFSKKLAKAPFRVFVFATHLEKWDLRYEDPLNPSIQVDPITKDTIESQSSFSSFMDNLFRHTAFGVEFTPSKSIFLRVGYNFKTFREMAVGDGFSFTGFTYGFGFRVKQIYFSYSRGNYHSVGSPNYITINANLNSFFKGSAGRKD